jgi:dTDP-glucose 4,6-dehydratase
MSDPGVNDGRFAVIGSNSFSGAAFVAHLLAEGHEVLGLSRSAEPHAAFLPYRWADAKAFRFVQADLNHDLPQMMVPAGILLALAALGFGVGAWLFARGESAA